MQSYKFFVWRQQQPRWLSQSFAMYQEWLVEVRKPGQHLLLCSWREETSKSITILHADQAAFFSKYITLIMKVENYSFVLEF